MTLSDINLNEEKSIDWESFGKQIFSHLKKGDLLLPKAQDYQEQV